MVPIRAKVRIEKGNPQRGVLRRAVKALWHGDTASTALTVAIEHAQGLHGALAAELGALLASHESERRRRQEAELAVVGMARSHVAAATVRE
jgi:hypothetical protein